MGNSDGTSTGLTYPLLDLWNAKKFGIKAYNARLVNVGADVALSRTDADGAKTEWRFRVTEMRNRLFNWYRLNAYFESGSMTIVGRDRARVGDPVFRPEQRCAFGGSKGMRYYTTGVSWAWSFGDQYTTTLQVSRGHNDDMLDVLKADIMADGSTHIPPNPNNYTKLDT
jgi:hypothetical protein